MRRSHAASCGSWLAALLAALMPFATPALAVEPDEILADPALETRARHISAGLRCLVCQNQSIDDSNAPLARDLRLLVRERLKAGDSDAQVMQFIEDRYGEFVLLRPPFNARTLLLWLAPFLALLAAIVVALRVVSRSRRTRTCRPQRSRARRRSGCGHSSPTLTRAMRPSRTRRAEVSAAGSAGCPCAGSLPVTRRLSPSTAASSGRVARPVTGMAAARSNVSIAAFRAGP